MTFTNETAKERIVAYVEAGEFEKADSLYQLCDYLYECYSWELTFDETTG